MSWNRISGSERCRKCGYLRTETKNYSEYTGGRKSETRRDGCGETDRSGNVVQGKTEGTEIG